MRGTGRGRHHRLMTAGLAALAVLSAGARPAGEAAGGRGLEAVTSPGNAASRFGFEADFGPGAFRIDPPPNADQPAGKKPQVLDPRDVTRTAQTVALFGLISLAPVAV